MWKKRAFKKPVFLESPKEHYIQYWPPETKQGLMSHLGWIEYVLARNQGIFSSEGKSPDELVDQIRGKDLKAAFEVVEGYAKKRPQFAARLIRASNDLVLPFLSRIEAPINEETTAQVFLEMRTGALLGAVEEGDQKARPYGVHPSVYENLASLEVLENPQPTKAREVGYLAFRSGYDFEIVAERIKPLDQAEFHPYQPPAPD
jgi:hypothetical protein